MNAPKNLLLITLCCLLASVSWVKAQINMPQPSPLATVSQKVGLSEVTITYSRPGMKGRKIFGDLVPFDAIWRTGANAATKISLSDAMEVEGKEIPAGDYALYTIPGKKEWTIILNKNLESSTTEYQESEEAARFKVPVGNAKEPVETFTILFSDVTDQAAKIHLLWANTKVAFSIEDADVDEQVMAQIEQQMAQAGDNAGLYFQAASYYFTNNKDLQKAQEWIDKAVSLDDTKYWMLHLQAKIHAKNNNEQQALEAAQKSMKLAEENGNMDYVRLNEQLIESLD